MLEVQEQCDGFSTKNEDIENLVGRQGGLMSFSICQLSLPVRVFVLASLARLSLLFSLNFPLCCSESEDSSDWNSWIDSSNSLCFVTCFFMSLSCPMYCRLSLTMWEWLVEIEENLHPALLTLEDDEVERKRSESSWTACHSTTRKGSFSQVRDQPEGATHFPFSVMALFGYHRRIVHVWNGCWDAGWKGLRIHVGQRCNFSG